MDIIWVCGIVAAALLLMYGIRYMKKLNMSFNVRVVTALVVGIIFGAILQLTVKDSVLIKKAMSWITLVGSGYVRLRSCRFFVLLVYYRDFQTSSTCGKRLVPCQSETEKEEVIPYLQKINICFQA